MGSKMSDSMTSMERMFIDAYRQMPNLWNVDHRDYNRKDKRNKSYDILLTILRTYMPEANRTNVRQKINILRSTYRKELRKYLASKTITENGDIIYTHRPASWKFDAMKFLDGLDTKEENDIDNRTYFTEGEVVIQDHIEDESLNELEDQEYEFIQEVETEGEGEQQSKIIVSPLELDSNINKVRLNRKRKPTILTEGNIIDRECDAIGSNVACKLLRMSPQQRCLAESLINKVLMNGLKDLLTDETDLMEASYVIEHKSEKIEC